MLHALAEWLHALIPIWFGWVEHWGYLGVVVLMAMESSIFPVPSEVVMPPAAYWAKQGTLNIYWVIIAGTFGSWLGSSITYWVAKWLGRLIVVKWGRYFFISEAKLERAERLVHRYETGGIFFARLLPVIRHLISIPAGIIRMSFATFSAMTIAGSALWCSVLSWFGYHLITKEMIENPAALYSELHKQSTLIGIGVAAFCVLYFLAMKLTAPKAKDGV